ncbi:hypothetical protein [Vallitalea okinawensis]|uniref:hypothetical protein n=1 Tax=Vallitalea okinawensis TaxID=2078660 RepID=UPI000CFAB2AF|nr:hypothetical protein [Vallitalea okinawensis]
MKIKATSKKILLYALVMIMCLTSLPIDALASEYTGEFDKSYKITKRVKVKFLGIKFKKKVKFGTVRVTGTYDMEDPDNIGEIKVYFRGSLILEGEADKNGVMVGRGYNVKLKGIDWRVTPCVKYYPSWGCYGLVVNIEGGGQDFDALYVPLGGI